MNTHKVKIIADSTCDLSPELIKKYDVEIDYNEGKVKFKYNNVDMFLH